MAHRKSPVPLKALLVTLMIVPPVAVLAAIPWLKQQPDGLVFLLSGIAATMTVIASFWIAVLNDRRLDEWQRSNARFSSQWGFAAGAGLVALLLALPAFRDLIVSWTASFAQAPDPDQKLVVLAFVSGFAAVVLAQTLCTMLLAVGWTYWMSRSARDRS